MNANKEAAFRLRETGLNYSEIARQLGISRERVRQYFDPDYGKKHYANTKVYRDGDPERPPNSQQEQPEGALERWHKWSDKHPEHKVMARNYARRKRVSALLSSHGIQSTHAEDEIMAALPAEGRLPSGLMEAKVKQWVESHPKVE